ncbi:sulfotransferase family protein [Crocinitomicaceae bacterium]|nr:sulfotransferase family protein [Crocinitomicaceae bacterium]
MSSTKRIYLWSGPRNISTTLMYSFAQRSDTKVFDEPLYGHYLSKTNAKRYHPSARRIIDSMECSGQKVIHLMTGDDSAEVLFFKNMTHHILDLDKSFMNKGINVILTRDPEDMLPSFHKVIPNPNLNDVGYKAHVDLINEFEENDIDYLVMDSKMILENPEHELTRLCKLVNIPYCEEMLSWPAGARAEDGVWANHWYHNVHNSTGFMKYQKKKEEFPSELLPLLEECKFLYKQLMNKI